MTFTDEQRALVKEWSLKFISKKLMADMLDIDDDTLNKHFRHELAAGRLQSDLKIAAALEDNLAERKEQTVLHLAKTRLGLTERQLIDLTSSDGSMTPSPEVAKKLSKLSDSALLELQEAYDESDADAT